MLYFSNKKSYVMLSDMTKGRALDSPHLQTSPVCYQLCFSEQERFNYPKKNVCCLSFWWFFFFFIVLKTLSCLGERESRLHYALCTVRSSSDHRPPCFLLFFRRLGFSLSIMTSSAEREWPDPMMCVCLCCMWRAPMSARVAYTHHTRLRCEVIVILRPHSPRYLIWL